MSLREKKTDRKTKGNKENTQIGSNRVVTTLLSREASCFTITVIKSINIKKISRSRFLKKKKKKKIVLQ